MHPPKVKGYKRHSGWFFVGVECLLGHLEAPQVGISARSAEFALPENSSAEVFNLSQRHTVCFTNLYHNHQHLILSILLKSQLL